MRLFNQLVDGHDVILPHPKPSSLPQLLTPHTSLLPLSYFAPYTAISYRTTSHHTILYLSLRYFIPSHHIIPTLPYHNLPPSFAHLITSHLIFSSSSLPLPLANHHSRENKSTSNHLPLSSFFTLLHPSIHSYFHSFISMRLWYVILTHDCTYLAYLPLSHQTISSPISLTVIA